VFSAPKLKLLHPSPGNRNIPNSGMTHEKLGAPTMNQTMWIKCMRHFVNYNVYFLVLLYPGPALAGAGPNARPRRGTPLSRSFMTSSCSVSRAMRPW